MVYWDFLDQKQDKKSAYVSIFKTNKIIHQIYVEIQVYLDYKLIYDFQGWCLMYKYLKCLLCHQN